MHSSVARHGFNVIGAFSVLLSCSPGRSTPAERRSTSDEVSTSDGDDVSRDTSDVSGQLPASTQSASAGATATHETTESRSATISSNIPTGPTPTADSPTMELDPDDLGAHPYEPSTLTRGGTMTFTNVGAPGWWPRRLEREAGDAACNYKDGSDTWGGHCCMTEYHTEDRELAPFNQEMTLILKAIDIKQLAVYQPASSSSGATWSRVTSWNGETRVSENLWFTQQGAGSEVFPGALTQTDCVGYVMQNATVGCEENPYFCPDDPGIMHRGFKGSKLVVFLGSMVFDDERVAACNGDGAGHPGPWVAFVASELVRDGGRKWNGACNCYSKTGSVGDGCGEINVFEVVMDNNDYSNREFASTGVRSFQAGHVGGAVCGAECRRETFPEDVEVVDACAQSAYDRGPQIEVGGETDGCPVWKRPAGDRYFFILLDETRRMIQVGVIHPGNVPAGATGLLPEVPRTLERPTIDALLDLRLPQP